ncbi:hypothetical protein M8J76_016780 [Diaphorina citri]|nr:hypothetical protein M8J75_004783 [Diaphorina citri]KAI5724190.1 hypothetical protein M8J76_016780 [Diaphorina citri]KAI5728774.1 hypothetical protein M8J77_020972 [Diaphorina citri]
MLLAISPQGRKGHKYRKVFPLIVAAYMVVSAFLLPMGFKFMLILGGTAIMFAKLAVALNALVLYRKSGPAHPVAYGVPVPVPYEHHQEVHDPQWAGWSQQGW